MPDLSSLPEIKVGSHLFHVGEPEIPEGSVLSSSAFGSRKLDRLVLAKQHKYGEDLKACFDMGPLAEQTFDLSRPREVDCLDSIRTMSVLGELVWEVVRLREFPGRPSRLDCLFFWQTESKARDWLSFRTWPSALYEVEVIEHRASFLADINRVQFSSQDGTVSGMMDRARTYWTERAGSTKSEVLLEGRVRFIKWLAGR